MNVLLYAQQPRAKSPEAEMIKYDDMERATKLFSFVYNVNVQKFKLRLAKEEEADDNDEKTNKLRRAYSQILNNSMILLLFAHHVRKRTSHKNPNTASNTMQNCENCLTIMLALILPFILYIFFLFVSSLRCSCALAVLGAYYIQLNRIQNH